jgi:hypothetical protein
MTTTALAPASIDFDCRDDDNGEIYLPAVFIEVLVYPDAEDLTARRVDRHDIARESRLDEIGEDRMADLAGLAGCPDNGDRFGGQ